MDKTENVFDFSRGWCMWAPIKKHVQPFEEMGLGTKKMNCWIVGQEKHETHHVFCQSNERLLVGEGNVMDTFKDVFNYGWTFLFWDGTGWFKIFRIFRAGRKKTKYTTKCAIVNTVTKHLRLLTCVRATNYRQLR